MKKEKPVLERMDEVKIEAHGMLAAMMSSGHAGEVQQWIEWAYKGFLTDGWPPVQLKEFRRIKAEVESRLSAKKGGAR